MARIDSLESLICWQEGFRGYVYDDATGQRVVPGYHMVGHPTFGWGFAFDMNPAQKAECSIMLAIRLTAAETDAKWALGLGVWMGLDPARRAAVASMAYQMGRTGLSAFHLMLDAVRAGDWRKAYDEALNSKWATQTPSRANAIALMLLTGRWPGDTLTASIA